jgi:hypothetical protein
MSSSSPASSPPLRAPRKRYAKVIADDDAPVAIRRVDNGLVIVPNDEAFFMTIGQNTIRICDKIARRIPAVRQAVYSDDEATTRRAQSHFIDCDAKDFETIYALVRDGEIYEQVSLHRSAAIKALAERLGVDNEFVDDALDRAHERSLS